MTVGLVGPNDWERFQHLSIGDICHVAISVSKQDDELSVYKVLFEMINKLIECGGTIKDAVDVMREQKMIPNGITTDPDIPICKSIVDFVAKYLKGRT